MNALEAALVSRWFDREVTDLRAVVERSSQISRYEHGLRVGQIAAELPAPAYVRNPAFRRVVAQSYDYRCAATGVRILLPTGEAMVEAAHIHPFSASGDDDPRNGIALTPNMHWAFDHNLIAPSPDFCWRVSDQLDARIPDYRELRDLDGKRLFLPSEPRLYPKRDVLDWRVARLRDSGSGHRPRCNFATKSESHESLWRASVASDLRTTDIDRLAHPGAYVNRAPGTPGPVPDLP
ncbi:MAG: HNH endonuclease [Betaproteobacteria bacterium]|nr:HNH endonuclease [Betaproteobacteria bacterium]